MNQLSLNVLGTPQMVLNGEALMLPRSARATALLVYLALEGPHPLPRATVAALLWPDVGESQARHNLRQALYEAQRYLKKWGGADFLQATHQTVRLLPNAGLAVDAKQFLNFIERGELERAAKLYRGDLMSGFSLAHSGEYENWLSTRREKVHRQALGLFATLTERCLRNRDFGQAQVYARRQLSLEPWHEEAHRQLIYALAAQGQRTAALAQYEECQRVLDREFSIAPNRETTTLYQTVLAEAQTRQAVGVGVDGSPDQAQTVIEPTLEAWIEMEPETRAALAQAGVFGTVGGAGAGHAANVSIGPLQRAKLTHLFQLFDHDGDGFLVAENFVGYAATAGARLGIALDNPKLRRLDEDHRGWWVGIHKTMGVEGDKAISLAEWLAYWSAWMAAVNAELTAATRYALMRFEESYEATFVFFDQDGDDAISAQEYADWLGIWAIADSCSSFRLLDVRGDGRLPKAQFFGYLRQFFFTNDPDALGNYLYGSLPDYPLPEPA